MLQYLGRGPAALIHVKPGGDKNDEAGPKAGSMAGEEAGRIRPP